MHYNFGFFAQTLEKSSTRSVSQADFVGELLSCGLDGYNSSIDKSNANNYFNNKKPIPRSFAGDSRSEKGKNAIINYLINQFLPNRIDSDDYGLIIKTLDEAIKNDPDIDFLTKNNLFSLKNDVTEKEYIAHQYLLSLKMNNVISNAKVTNTPYKIQIGNVMIKDKKLYVDGVEMKVPEELLPPDITENEEKKYVDELLIAYSQDDNNNDSFTPKTLPSKYKSDFQYHRVLFFRAETIRRRLRDIIPKEFEVLKQDVYHGIYHFVNQPFKSNLDRINNTMIHVTKLETKKSKLEQLQGWISIPEKQGICHMLVNEESITWIK